MAAGKIMDAAEAAPGRRHAPPAARVDGRWCGQGHLAGIAGFALVALCLRFRGTLDQSGVGPVGLWLGWAAFWAFAMQCLPASDLYGRALSSRPLAQGWPGLAGLILLLVGDRHKPASDRAELRILGRHARLAGERGAQRLHRHRGDLDHPARHPARRRPLHHSGLSPHAGRRHPGPLERVARQILSG
jgi:hypothetical protein